MKKELISEQQLALIGKTLTLPCGLISILLAELPLYRDFFAWDILLKVILATLATALLFTFSFRVIKRSPLLKRMMNIAPVFLALLI